MFLVNTLSCAPLPDITAPLPDITACNFTRSVQDVDHTASLVLSDEQLLQFKHASADDPVLQVWGK